MKYRALAVLSFFYFNLLVSAGQVSNFNYKSAFYKVFSSSDTAQLNQQIKQLPHLNIAEKQAYTGALIMKKAGLIGPLNRKIRLFAEGRKQLEAAIKSDLQNAEYRFLRLAVQENCPPILKYNNDIKEDAKKIRASFKSMGQDLKSAILDYCKSSKNLKVEDL